MTSDEDGHVTGKRTALSGAGSAIPNIAGSKGGHSSRFDEMRRAIGEDVGMEVLMARDGALLRVAVAELVNALDPGFDYERVSLQNTLVSQLTDREPGCRVAEKFEAAKVARMANLRAIAYRILTGKDQAKLEPRIRRSVTRSMVSVAPGLAIQAGVLEPPGDRNALAKRGRNDEQKRTSVTDVVGQRVTHVPGRSEARRLVPVEWHAAKQGVCTLPGVLDDRCSCEASGGHWWGSRYARTR